MRRLPGLREVAEGSQGPDALGGGDRALSERSRRVNETIRITGEIDAVIDVHGGWPIR